MEYVVSTISVPEGNSVRGIAVDKNGTLFCIIANNSTTLFAQKTSIIKRKGNIWKDIFVYAPERFLSIAVDQNGHLFLGTAGAILQVNIENGEVIQRHKKLDVTALCFNREGSELYCASVNDFCIHCIKINLPSEVEFVAGSRQLGYQDGHVLQASFGLVSGIAVDDGVLYISNKNCIRKIESDVVTTYCGYPSTAGLIDGPVSRALFNGDQNGIVLDKQGNILVCDAWNGKIRKIDTKNNVVSTIAGTGNRKVEDGPAMKASFAFPRRIVVYGTSIYVAETTCVRKLTRIVSWKLQRLFWLGRLKNGQECLLSQLPKEIIREIMRWIFILGVTIP